MDLLTTGNPKTDKGRAFGYLTAILHLAPADLAGRGTVCPHSTAGCRAACLNLAGRGGIMRRGETSNRIQDARIRKTRQYFDDRPAFLARLDREIGNHKRRAERAGLRPAVRLNGTSDVAWERVAPDMLARWTAAGVRFYDYTKNPARALAAAERRDTWPAGYDITFSWSGQNANEARAVLAAGGRVAVPFAGKVPIGSVALILNDTVSTGPAGAIGFPVVDGDASDLRFLDGRGVVVGLKAKGPARRDASGFVVRS